MEDFITLPCSSFRVSPLIVVMSDFPMKMILVQCGYENCDHTRRSHCKVPELSKGDVSSHAKELKDDKEAEGEARPFLLRAEDLC